MIVARAEGVFLINMFRDYLKTGDFEKIHLLFLQDFNQQRDDEVKLAAEKLKHEVLNIRPLTSENKHLLLLTRVSRQF